MKIYKYPEKNTWQQILQRPTQTLQDLEPVVEKIFQDVKDNGDTALKKYTQQFDQVSIDHIQTTEEEIQQAGNQVPDTLKQAIQAAKQNIEKFHLSQKQNTEIIETTEGVSCWHKYVPIEKVGLYIPGGTAPLFSTVLMLGVPAKIAKCKEIVLCTPPNQQAQIHPAILYTAHLIGITKIYKVGGIQAIASLTYGTETIPQVYKIFGPGNQYVTVAKQIANKIGTAIDMPAGPSEVLVYADHTANPNFVASDLLSQAEHGTDSQVILVTINPQLIEDTQKALEQQQAQLLRQEQIKQTLQNSTIVLLKNKEEAIKLINEYAPEHLIIASENESYFIQNITNAGSVFLGNYTPESAGDYASGTNHTLPTNGYAKMYSGVSLNTFLKKISFQKITQQGIQNIGKHVEIMAEAEHLAAHKNAVTIRLKSLQ